MEITSCKKTTVFLVGMKLEEGNRWKLLGLFGGEDFEEN